MSKPSMVSNRNCASSSSPAVGSAGSVGAGSVATGSVTLVLIAVVGSVESVLSSIGLVAVSVAVFIAVSPG